MKNHKFISATCPVCGLEYNLNSKQAKTEIIEPCKWCQEKSAHGTRNTQHATRICRTCKSFKDVETGFYEYKDGKVYADCIECTKARANSNYSKRPKSKRMSDEDIDAYLKSHPIPRKAIRKRSRIRYAD